jgi:tape measure domain-containing protein
VDDELVVRAAIRDELSAPLESIREELRRTGRQSEETGRQASRGGRGFDAMAGGIGRMARTAGRVGLYAVAGLGTAIVSATGYAATFGIKTAASMETARIAFSTMLGSGKKADAFLKDLSAFAAKTPFEFPELQTAASSLISAGIEANKVIPIMTTLGDVTSGMGTGAEGVQRATVALQQMNAAQKVNAEDLNQLRDAGIPVYDLLAASMGKTKEEVAKMAAAGTLGAEGLDAIMKGLETGKGLERFTGLMEKQSASLEGVASTFKDTLGMGLAKALEPAVPILKDMTAGASELVADGMGPLQDGVANVIERGQELYESGKLQKWAGEGKDAVVDFWHAIEPLVGELFELGKDALPLVGVTLGTVVELIKTAAQVAAPLVGGFNDLDGSAKKVLLFAAAIYFLSGKMGDLRARGGQAIESLRQVDKRMVAMRGAAGIAGGAMLLFADDVGKSHQGLGDLMTIGGSVAIGFAAGGPIGAAIGGLGGLFTVFTGRTKKAAEAQEKLDAAGRAVAATLDEQTGALGDNTDAVAAKQLADSGAFQAARKIGVSNKTVLDAALGNVAAQREINKASEDYLGIVDKKASKILADSGGEVGAGMYDKATESVKLLGDATGATSTAIDRERRKIDDVNAALGKTPPAVTVQFDVNTSAGQTALDRLNASIDKARQAGTAARGQTASGDTASSRARGVGGMAATLRAHQAAGARSGAHTRITNAFVGGGGRGHGSGDHQAGKALDLQGSGLHAYARETRAAGGYAAFHGHGSNRHLHAVPGPAGDTATSRAASPTPRTHGGTAVAPVIIGAGAIVVTNPSDTVDLEQGIADGIERYLIERAERG